jgi:hypothetical protein
MAAPKLWTRRKSVSFFWFIHGLSLISLITGKAQLPERRGEIGVMSILLLSA